MWRSLVNLFLLAIGLFSLVTFCASLRSSPLYLLLRSIMKGYQEIIWDNSEPCCWFFCVLLFSSLPYLAFAVRIFAVVCCSLTFSQSGWASLVLPFLSAPQPFPPVLSSLAAAEVRWQESDAWKLPGWNPGVMEGGGRIPTDFSVARVSPFSFEVFSASESQHFCKLCFPSGTHDCISS